MQPIWHESIILSSEDGTDIGGMVFAGVEIGKGGDVERHFDLALVDRIGTVIPSIFALSVAILDDISHMLLKLDVGIFSEGEEYIQSGTLFRYLNEFLINFVRIPDALVNINDLILET